MTSRSAAAGAASRHWSRGREGDRRGTGYALRFRAYGRRECLTLVPDADGWSRQRAEDELEDTLQQVARGVWQPPPVAAPAPLHPDPTFHELASDWWAEERSELRPNTVAAYEDELTVHLLPFFHRHRLSQITVAEVDR